MVRLSHYEADVGAMFARASHHFCVTFTHVNGFTPAILPASYDGGSVVAVKPVMCRKELRRLSLLEPPPSAACAMALRHRLNCSGPITFDAVRHEFS
jgi:hypothetical protein